MQRILSAYDWQRLPAGQAMVIETDIDHQRSVRLRVNAPSAVSLFIQQPDIDEDLFLARVEGLDEIQFDILGSYKLFAVGGELWFDTLDGTKAHVEPVDDVSFTNIVERVAQNPELLIMERKMQENIERRMNLLVGSFEKTLAQKDAELVAARKAASNAGGNTSEPNAGQVPPNPPAEPASGGTGGQPNA